MDFSHLDDTKFPNLETASPYALKNTFDYTRWVPDTEVHLVNVLWGNDYANVVKFEDEQHRDSWFDGVSDTYVLKLQSNARIVPGGTIKLPLPYDVAACYNYLYIDIPIATSRERMIQNETENGKRRWYFFIGDISYSAPNTTVLQLQADIWTNFIYKSDIKYMMLERGHAPVAKSDTDAYLANPIANNRYLLAPDVSFDDTTVVRDSKYVPFGNGEKWICLASTAGYQQVQSGALGTAAGGSGFIAPTFSDTSDWYGYQLQVNGYSFDNGKDYSSLRACVNPYNRPGNIVPTSLEVFAFPAADSTFLADVTAQCPAFLRTLEAMFVVDGAMIDASVKLSFCGHDLWFVTGRENDMGNYDLEKGMFGFDENEQRFAKLYTYPYSRIEVSDNTGKTVEVRIENTGKIGMKMLTSVAFPVLDCRVFLTGINGVGSQSYVWKNLGGDDLNKLVPNGDWDKLMFELSIPTYAVYMDSETSYMLNNYSSMQNAREQALTAYHNAVRSSNSDYANSRASAETGNGNAVRSANTARTNAKASASTNKSNTDNLNSCNYNNVNLTIAANTANTDAANFAASTITGDTNLCSINDTADGNKVSLENTDTQNNVTTATTANTANANIQTSVASGAVSGAAGGMGNPAVSAGMAVAGAVLGAYTSGVSAHAANSNAVIVTQAQLAVTSATTGFNSRSTTRHTSTASGNTTTDNNNRTKQTNNANSALAGQRDNNFNTTAKNASNLLNTQNANADRTNSADVSNANATRDTSYANAGRARQVQVLNAQEQLRTAQDVQQRSIRDAGRGNPEQLTRYTGKGENWAFGQNGVQFRLRTQSDSAIAQTAAQFARFGYNLNQLWDVEASGLNLMKNFTYWKANDVWVDVRNAASSEVSDVITEIFRGGTTVWSDPDKIGKVGIYDN